MAELDLDAIEAMVHDDVPIGNENTFALVAEVRRLLVEVDRLHNLLDGYRGALAETEADRDLFRSAAGWGDLP